MTTATTPPAQSVPGTSAPAFSAGMEPMPSFTEADARRFRKAKIRGFRDRGLLIALGLSFLLPALGAVGLPWAFVGRAVLALMSIALLLWCAGLFWVRDWKNEGRAIAFFVLYNVVAMAVFLGTLWAEAVMAKWFGRWVLVLAPLPLVFEIVALHWWEKQGGLGGMDDHSAHDYIGE